VAWPTFWYTEADRSVNALEFNIRRFLEAGHAEKSLLSKVPSSQIENLGHLLYIDFYYLFLMVGIVLLVAMVGGLVLTTSRDLKKNEYRK
jgi:hypothetical protein